MSIEEKLREIAAASVPELAWVFGTMTEIDAKIDLIKPPFIWCVFPDVGVINVHNGRFKEGIRVLVGFYDRVIIDAQGENNMRAYRRMAEKAKRFISQYNNSGYFEPLDGNIETTIHAEIGADNFTGLMLDITAVERDRKCIE